jgi:hypothetical protein
VSIGASGCNDLVYAFGSLMHEQAMRLLLLFTSKIMPVCIEGDGLE